MDEKRRTRFEGRVDLEREFLTPINGLFGSSAPLTGMTQDAILSWQSRAKEFCAAVQVERVARILLEASSRAHLLADNSKDVFEPDVRPKASSVLELRKLLEAELEKTSCF
jgi:hypothetical protein